MVRRGAPRSLLAGAFGPVACALLFASPAALAQPSNGAMAEALFRDGRSLMASGNLAAACPKFAESNRIDPKLGTLLNLALCHEKSGRTASAWAEYNEAATLAGRAGQADREKVASEHAAQLEPGLSRVILDLDPRPGETVALDDQPVGPAAYHTPIPVDPGSHVLHASAAGMAPYDQPFDIAKGTALTTLKVPDLQPAPQEAGHSAPAEVSEAQPRAPSSQLRTVGFAVGAAGLVLAGLGTYFGIHAFSDKTAVENECGATFCTPAGNNAKGTLKTDETLSTVGVIVGVVAIGTGVTFVLWNRGNKAPASGVARVSLGVAPRGVQARIAW